MEDIFVVYSRMKRTALTRQRWVGKKKLEIWKRLLKNMDIQGEWRSWKRGIWHKVSGSYLRPKCGQDSGDLRNSNFIEASREKPNVWGKKVINPAKIWKPGTKPDVEADMLVQLVSWYRPVSWEHGNSVQSWGFKEWFLNLKTDVWTCSVSRRVQPKKGSRKISVKNWRVTYDMVSILQKEWRSSLRELLWFSWKAYWYQRGTKWQVDEATRTDRGKLDPTS